MKKQLILAGLVALTTSVASAAVYSYNFTSGFANGGVIPDGNVTGWSDNRSVALVADFGPQRPGDTTLIRDVNVTLNIAGGYNGDLYAYLVHSSGYAVLLNRSGKTSGNAFGYGDAGFNITLDGEATTYNQDIHLYNAATPAPSFGSGKLTGTWLEDGRTADPATVLDTDSRLALLSSFHGVDADGTWTLFLADMSGGDVSTLLGWGLDITVIPETTTWGLILFGVVVAGWQARRYWRTRATA